MTIRSFLGVFFGSFLFFGAGSLEALRLDPVPEVAELPAGSGALSTAQLTHLALVLSGADPATVSADEAQIDQWKTDLSAALSGQGQAELADNLLRLLHQKYFHSYSTEQTRLDTLVETGNFNCVSSALVYMILGRSLGLDVQAVAVPSHAFCIVRFPDKSVDVETTTASGFDPGTKKEFHNQFGATTGYVYVPPGNYQDRRVIDERGLLGLLLQNRCALLQESGNSEDAVGPSIDRWVLERSPEAWQMLTSAFQNAAASFNDRRDYLGGLSLLGSIERWTGVSPMVKDLTKTFVTNEASQLISTGDYQGAQTLVATWKSKGFLDSQDADKIDSVLWDNQLTSALPNLSPAEAVRRIESAYGAQEIGASRRLSLLSWVYSKATVQLAKEKGFEAAVAYLNEIPPEVLAVPEIQRIRGEYVYNWATEIHNRFASLWNGGQEDLAKKVLEDGLKKIPDSQILLDDRRRLP